MSNIEIGFMGLAGLMVLLFLRVPIGATLGIVSLLGVWAVRGSDAALSMMGTAPYDFAASWTLSAAPMFLLMGAFAVHYKLTDGLYLAARVWLDRLPGGVAVASNFASAGFAAASGSSIATTAAMGRLAIPQMLKLGYDPALATGVIAAAGTLGALIPPSIAFVVYGWYSEMPIDKLLIAGVLPGILTAVVYALLIIVRVKINPALAPRTTEVHTSAEKWAMLKDIWPLPVLILSVIGTLYSGLATSTEAAAAGAATALVIGLIRRQGTWRTFVDATVEALKTTASLFFIVIGAVLFTRFLAVTGLPEHLSSVISKAAVSPMAVILTMTVIYLILGMFLDPIGVMLVTLPILLPICTDLNIDLIWLGVLVVKYIEIGMLTPPVGMHTFVVKSVVGDQVPIRTIYIGCLWFLAAEVLIMSLLVGFPQISLFLPGLMK